MTFSSGILARALHVSVVMALGYPAAQAAAQDRSIASGQRLAVLTDRHGWVSGRFQEIRNDSVVLSRDNSGQRYTVPYESVLGWRVPASRGIGRAVRLSLLGGIFGSVVGVGVGYEGATKVTATRDVKRESLRFGVSGAVLGLAFSAKLPWRDVPMALAAGEGTPGEQMLVMQGAPIVIYESRTLGSTATSSTARTLITRSELDMIQGASTSALDAVRRLRPQFLRARRAEVAREALVLPTVYLDGVRLGELRTLEAIHLSSVLEIQYYSPIEATTRWGTGHEGGVIHVTTRRA